MLKDQQVPREIREIPGPATIRIGETITLDSTENAFVENIGTKEDAVLKVHIPNGIQGPKGEKGDKEDRGPIGLQGFPGEISISEVITIDGTETTI